MRKLLTMAFVLFYSLCISSQLEWNPKEYSAIDESRGYSWNLPYDKYHTWNKQDGKEEHTVFRAFQPQTGVIAFLNFQPFDKVPIYDSILDVYDEVEKILSVKDTKMEEKGVHIDRQNYVYNFNGAPSIYSYYIQRYRNRKTGKVEVTHCLSFLLMGTLGTYIVAVKCSDACFVKHGIAYLSGVASGFFLVPKE